MEKNILVIDDDEDVLSVLEDILIYSNFKVKGISRTDGIFDIIENFGPNLILMDHILAGVNGGDLCQQIKLDGRTSHLPVVLISAYPKVLQSFDRYGCDAFIAKPFDMDDLINCVNKYLIS